VGFSTGLRLCSFFDHLVYPFFYFFFGFFLVSSVGSSKSLSEHYLHIRDGVAVARAVNPPLPFPLSIWFIPPALLFCLSRARDRAEKDFFVSYYFVAPNRSRTCTQLVERERTEAPVAMTLERAVYLSRCSPGESR
jgi:hypothetical protein